MVIWFSFSCYNFQNNLTHRLRQQASLVESLQQYCKTLTEENKNVTQELAECQEKVSIYTVMWSHDGDNLEFCTLKLSIVQGKEIPCSKAKYIYSVERKKMVQWKKQASIISSF